jgi:precorrin-3B synthase
MSRALARGACPGLSAPMETGDGLLARLLPNGPIPLDAFIGLCEAAGIHGNGIIEVTARGSLQMRGLTPLSAPRFADAVAALDIHIAESVPVIPDPVPDDPSALIDANGLAAQLRQAIDEAGLTLAPKVSVVVDGGGRLDLDALTADIRLRAVPTREGPRFQLALAGDAASAVPVATISPGEAVAEVLALLKLIATRGPGARAIDALPKRAGRQPQHATSLQSSRSDPVGCHPLKGGAVALGLGLAFGHAEASALLALARIAMANGAGWARPAPGRALLFGPLSQVHVEATREAAERLGFVAEASDPRRRIAACPGAPSCAQGLIAARALAAELASHLKPPGDGIAVHISGCAKGCAHPRAAPLTIVGTEKGCGIVHNGSAPDRPEDIVDPADLAAALDTIAAETREAVNA